mgnify:CR=1 FL=1
MPNVELGPPSENVIELSRVVDRGIRESKMINLDDLVLLEGKSVYTVFVDVSVINADGNLFDAVSYAALVALSLAKFNKYKIDKKDNVVQTNVVTDLSVKFTPISITHIKIDDHIIVDPTASEESLTEISCEVALDGIESGEFPPGSMGPKLSAMVMAKQTITDCEVLMCQPGDALKALRGESGTRLM